MKNFGLAVFGSFLFALALLPSAVLTEDGDKIVYCCEKPGGGG